MSYPASPVSEATTLTEIRTNAHSMAFVSSSSSSATSLLTSDSEVDSGGFLKSSFRAGGPVICSLPASLEPLSRRLREFMLEQGRETRCLHLADQILLRYRLNPSERYFTGRQSIIGKEPQPILTLLIVMRREPVPDSTIWREVAKKIKITLHSILTHLSVEIIDERLLHRGQCFPVESTHPIFPVWLNICEQILQGAYNTREWVALDCWRYGYEDNASNNEVSVIVSVQETAEGSFHTAAQQVKEVLARNSVENVNVLFIKSDICFISDKPEIGPELPDSACTQYVLPGVSIGIRNSSAGLSTLGGIVELKQRSEWHQFALTCFHCVYPPETPETPDRHRSILHRIPGAQASFAKWMWNPILPNDNMAKQLLRIEQPSTFDLKNTIVHLSNRIKSLRDPEYERLHRLKEAIKKGSDDFLTPRQELNYEMDSKIIEHWEDRRAFFEGFLSKNSHKLGHVFCGSGLHHQIVAAGGYRQIMDWALIRVDKERIPTDAHTLAEIGRPFAYGVNEVPNRFSYEPAVDTGLFDKILFKTGRSTKKTSGRYHGLQKCMLHREPDETAPAGYRIVPTFTHSVSILDNQTFCEPGDSGSLIYKESEKVVGMFFAVSQRINTWNFQLISDIFDDIKIVSGASEVRFV
ncbi:hypothetical protein N7481_002478 [Penicillium waksmanii]|uniref:uncharacterized protein n=1 Tax=Penicillium waksmanii TaxID=69791 RepID=UPI0025494643|nr:uncharacterized protein N7481_002478 [Penicillium waksmanii]KAJ5995501.1 hypothetical protein N7481_002478 [Penicillium waksmanii]